MGHQIFRLSVVSLLLVATIACDQTGPADTAAVVTNTKSDATDPVVATVNGVNLHATELRAVYDALPAEARQLPFGFLQDQLLPVLVNRTLMASAASDEGYADNDEVKQQVAIATADIMREVWIFDQIEARNTDEKLRALYDARIAETASDPDAGIERHARHILVEEEDLAIDLIKQLDDGADFITLANAHSTDAASADGDLGYFSRGVMVEVFEESTFSMEVGKYSAAPVESQFGWHIILVEDERAVVPPTLEALRDELAQGEVRSIYESIIKELRAAATIDIPGADVEETALEPLPTSPNPEAEPAAEVAPVSPAPITEQ